MKNIVQTVAAPASLPNRQSRQFINTALLIGVLALSTLMAAVPYSGNDAAALAPQEMITGEWTAELRKEKDDQIQLTLKRQSAKGHKSNSGFGIQLSELQGLTREQAFGTGTNVRFRLMREAGTFEFEGTFREGKGTGTWTLTPSQSFLSAMQARGIDNLTEEQRVAAAMLDVRTKTVDDLKSAGFTNLSIDDVFKATIFKLTPEYIAELKSLGYENLGLEEMVKARIFKIDAEFAREVDAMGFRAGSLESLVKMRIFKITPDFLREMRNTGLENLSVEDLVKLKIFKIDASFIERAKASGHAPLNVEKLVKMKIFEKAK